MQIASIERSVQQTDSLRHMTIVLGPKFLLTSGAELLPGPLARLRDPLLDFVGEATQAVSFSAHLSDNLFLELRAVTAPERSPNALINDLRQRMAGLPARVETYMSNLELQPYGRAVLLRYPRMIATLESFTRAGIEERQAVLRAYLPAVAAHNLVMSTELALLERPARQSASVAAAAAAPKTIAQLLEQPISLSFPKDTLERCMELLGKEIDTEIVILGSDLQLEGITKNQSFALDEHNRPAGQILAAVLAKANPEGKLVVVARPKEPGGKEAIFVTTKAAAAKRGEKPIPLGKRP